jgi:starch synthase
MPEKKRSAPKAKPAAAPPARLPNRRAERKTQRIVTKAKPPVRPVSGKKAQASGPSVLMISSEAHPFASTGGLAEVAGALPHALARLGYRVTLVLPRYRRIDLGGAGGELVTLQLGERSQQVTFISRVISDRVTAVFVDAPDLFDRAELYGEGDRDYPDNAWRFAAFSRAALEYARRTGDRPSVIHAHDWQAGLVPVFQKMLFSSDPVVGGVPTVFTIHNLAFQGLFPQATLPAIGLGREVFNQHALEYWGQISFLKGGINFSERITTVSPTYAREVLTRELGFGFDGVLARRAEDLSGILNGIDVERWNPASDAFVPVSFSADDLSGKARAKEVLLEAVGLPVDDGTRARPLIGLMSRLTDQKGFDLLAAATDELMTLDATWVLLGSGEHHYEEAWRALAARYPDRVSTIIGYDEQLTHRIEAGADIFLMPSRFEPCGLNQQYSLRYGTVPVVRAVGGLEDTVQEVSGKAGNGFKFREYAPSALVATLRRALDAYRNPVLWKKIQKAGMKQDHSWDASAGEYVKVYEEAGALAPAVATANV